MKEKELTYHAKHLIKHLPLTALYLGMKQAFASSRLCEKHHHTLGVFAPLRETSLRVLATLQETSSLFNHQKERNKL